jgi:glycosyltransferase involved in cell wall biosynthesis
MADGVGESGDQVATIARSSPGAAPLLTEGAESCRLTIGMPAYNNARTIRRALDSLLAQTYTDFRLLISDDGSTDGTAEICEEYPRRDHRIRLVRQPRNLNYGNFRFLLQRAETPLFMFAAGDDWWHQDYVARMVDALDHDASAVCAVSRVVFMKQDEPVRPAVGTRPLVDGPTANLVRFLQWRDDNTRMYGVFRTAVAQRAFPTRDFFGFDWAFSAGTLREGKHLEIPEVLLWRDYTESHRYVEYVRRDADRALTRVLPMLPLTRDLVSRLRLPVTPALIRDLIVLNLTFHVAYLRRYHPIAASTWGRLMAALVRATTLLRR